MKKILVTSFEPFGGEKVNPSQLAVAELPDEIDGAKIIKQVLPVVFDKSIDILYERLKQEKVEAVICVGQAGGRSEITVERVAININDAPIGDNAQNQPIDQPIFPDGPTAYFSTLPIKTIVQKCNEIGIPTAISNTAGTFVCNHLMYGACHYATLHQPTLKAGFVHIPFIPEQTVDKPHMPSMLKGDIVAGLVALIQTIIHTENDIQVSGGATH